MDKTGLEARLRHWRVGLIVATVLLAANCSGLYDGGTFEPASGNYFTVTAQKGDSVSQIAQRYGVRTHDVVAMNELANPDVLRVGQALKIPAYGRERDKESEVVANSYQIPRAAVFRSELAPPPAQPVNASYEPARPASGDSGWFSKINLTSTRSEDAQFVWPVKGAIIAPYGALPNGEQNDGINIAAMEGVPVHAAADGTVSYVGNELKGYGNLVLIRHDNGYVTAYAHTGRIVVARGERVTQGQTIAYAGGSGGVSAPQLHFEIRRGTTPIDPKPLLIASR